MPTLTAADFDVANVITNIGLAGAALITIGIATLGFRKLVSFIR